MTDNVDVTPGVGATIATNDKGGRHTQVIQLDIGDDATISPVTSLNPLPVTTSSLPLPTGAATETTLAGVLTALGGTLTMSGTVAISGGVTVSATNLDIRDLTSASDSVAAVQSGTWTVGVSGSVAVTGPLTNTQLRASAVPVSLASVPTHAVTQSGTWNIGSITTLPALPAGTNNIGDVDVLSLPALPSGSNTIGGVNLTQYTPVSGRLPVDGSGVTQPVSGTVTATPGANSSTTAATLAQGVKTVAAAATPEVMVGSTTKVESVIIQAKKGFNSANTSAVFVGLTSTNDSNYLELLPGDSVTFNAPAGKKIDLNLIYIEVVTNGDGVTYTSVN